MKVGEIFKKLVRLNKESRKRVLDELKRKHRLVILDSATYQEKFSFRLSGLNLFVAIGIGAITLIIITSALIVFTPLREFIPGYTQLDLVHESYENTQRLDSLETVIRQQKAQMDFIKSAIAGKESMEGIEKRLAEQKASSTLSEEQATSASDKVNKSEIEKSKRQAGETANQNGTNLQSRQDNIRSYFFFNPIKGKVLKGFDVKTRHLGIDVAGKENEIVKSVYEGVVFFSDWTVGTGYVIAIQHPNNIISVYKHNSSLLKKMGEVVRAGEPIAFIGNSGEYTSGPHLHFELWYDGNPLNPLEYIVF